ncbi:hypothetical protein Hanom_Chr09g00854141 [Helianthus anomalus]
MGTVVVLGSTSPAAIPGSSPRVSSLQNNIDGSLDIFFMGFWPTSIYGKLSFRDDVIKQLVRELKYLDETLPLRIKVGVNNDDFPTIYPPFSVDDGQPSWSEV